MTRGEVITWWCSRLRAARRRNGDQLSVQQPLVPAKVKDSSLVEYQGGNGPVEVPTGRDPRRQRIQPARLVNTTYPLSPSQVVAQVVRVRP